MINAREPIEVPDMILGHRARPAKDLHQARRTTRAQQITQLGLSHSMQLFVRHVDHLGLQRPTEKHADEHLSLWRAAGEFQAGETSRENPALLDRWHDEAETVHGMGDLRTIVGEHYDR